MIKIKTLEFSNCFAYGLETQKLNMQGSKLTQVVGKNGSGKSSIPSVLEELFYSKNSKGVAKTDIPNRYTKDPKYSMKSEFSVNGQDYTITKSVSKATTKVELLKGEENVSGHTTTQTYKVLHDILGVDFPTFTKLVYQSMNSSLDFLTATDTARKKFLIGLLDLDKYVEVESALKEAKKEASSVLETAIKEKSKLENTLTGIKVPELEELLPEPEQLIAYDELIEALSLELGASQASIKDYDQKLRAYQSFCVNRDKLGKSLEAVKQQLEEARNIEIEEVEEPTEPAELNELEGKQEELKHVLWEMQQVKSKYKASKDAADKTKCGECGSVLDTSHAEQLTNTLRAKFGELAETRDVLQEEVDTLLGIKSACEKARNRWVNTTKRKTDTENLVKVLEEKVGQIEESLENLEPVEEPTSPEDLQVKNRQVKEEIIKHKTDKQKWLDVVEQVRKENLVKERSNATRESKLEQVEQTQKELGKVAGVLGGLENRVSQLTTLCNIFGSKGLIGYKIESSVKVFEEQLNHYLSELSKGQMALGFELEDSKLKVVVYSSGATVSIKTLSSGELSKVNIATLLSIRNLMSKISKTHINTLFLDEVVSVIDVDGMEDLIQVLLGEQHLNTYIVSHGYTHPLVDVLTVAKTNNIAEIK